MKKAAAPLAPARLTDRHWVVDRCPHCGAQHAHGRGSSGADPREYLGHRAADCGGPGSSAGYVLVASAPA